jgi:hypothetical protein
LVVTVCTVEQFTLQFCCIQLELTLLSVLPSAP